MIETREKVINDCVYSVTQLPARRAIRLKAKLFKLFGAGIVKLFSSDKEKDTEEMTIKELESFCSMSEYEKKRIEELKTDSMV